MLEDILAVVWKERKGLFRVQGSRMRFVLILASPLLLATVFPITFGLDWLSTVPPLIISTIMAVVLVAVMVPDSFAGERERHTLETLLASRLPDRAILFGKLIMPMAMGLSASVFCLLWSMVVVNVAHWQGQFLFFTPPIFLGSLALSFCMALLTAGAGVFVSMRVSTAQEASQILMAGILVPPMLLQVVPLLFRDQLSEIIESINGPQLLAIVVAVLAVLAVAVVAVTVARFQRSRLIDH